MSKIIREKVLKSGNRQMTIELRPHEMILMLNKGAHYKLGYPVEDIVEFTVMHESHEVSWDSVSQQWVDA